MLIWNMVKFKTPSVPNPTVFQIRFGKSEIEMSIWEYPCPKHDYVPNPIWDIPNRIWNTVGFGTVGVPNLTMFQINIGTFGSWLGFSYVIPNPTMYQTYLC